MRSASPSTRRRRTSTTPRWRSSRTASWRSTRGTGSRSPPPGRWVGMSPAASDLRALHVPGNPLVLPNTWDAASAKLVEDAGFPVVATSSAAVARVLGSDDHEAMSAEDALAAVTRIVGAVSVPVTADFEAGYGLDPDAIAYGLLGAGAVGCNIEDSDHHGPDPLVDAATHAARLAALRAAAGDALVINARVDTFA